MARYLTQETHLLLIIQIVESTEAQIRNLPTSLVARAPEDDRKSGNQESSHLPFIPWSSTFTYPAIGRAFDRVESVLGWRGKRQRRELRLEEGIIQAPVQLHKKTCQGQQRQPDTQGGLKASPEVMTRPELVL